MSHLPSAAHGELLLQEPLCQIPCLRNHQCPIAISRLFAVSGLKAGQLQSSQAFRVQAMVSPETQTYDTSWLF